MYLNLSELTKPEKIILFGIGIAFVFVLASTNENISHFRRRR